MYTNIIKFWSLYLSVISGTTGLIKKNLSQNNRKVLSLSAVGYISAKPKPEHITSGMNTRESGYSN